MTDCCQNKACELDVLRQRQSSTLKAVLAINLAMFLVELSAGLLAGSVALLADSLDMLGDAMVYGFSLYVVGLGTEMKAKAAMFKGLIMGAFGLFVLGQVIYELLVPTLPSYSTIGIIGLIALGANALCLYLLWSHRAEDINMQSVWLCSRNDIIANSAVLVAAVAVAITASPWPDIIVGLGIAALFLRSSWFVLRGASVELRSAKTAT